MDQNDNVWYPYFLFLVSRSSDWWFREIFLYFVDSSPFLFVRGLSSLSLFRPKDFRTICFQYLLVTLALKKHRSRIGLEIRQQGAFTDFWAHRPPLQTMLLGDLDVCGSTRLQCFTILCNPLNIQRHLFLKEMKGLTDTATWKRGEMKWKK